MSKRRKIDWLAFEASANVIFKETLNAAQEGDRAAWREGIYRLDACLDAFTRRGHSFAEPKELRLKRLIARDGAQ